MNTREPLAAVIGRCAGFAFTVGLVLFLTWRFLAGDGRFALGFWFGACLQFVQGQIEKRRQ